MQHVCGPQFDGSMCSISALLPQLFSVCLSIWNHIMKKGLVLLGDENNFSVKSPWWDFDVVTNFDLIFKMYSENYLIKKRRQYLKSISSRLMSCWIITFLCNYISLLFYKLFPRFTLIFRSQRLTWLSKVLQELYFTVFALKLLRCIFVHIYNLAFIKEKQSTF